jgi:hypothetical protein
LQQLIDAGLELVVITRPHEMRVCL